MKNMKFSSCLLLAWIFSFTPINAQSICDAYTPYTRAMSQSNVADVNYYPDLLINPATIAFASNTFIQSSLQQHFFIRALNLYSLACIYPNKYGSISLNYQALGFKQYREEVIHLGYAKHFDKQWAMGLGIDYWNIKYPEPYTKIYGIHIRLGLLFKINNKLHLGLSILQLCNNLISHQPKPMDNKAYAGLSYQINSSKRLNLAISSQNQEVFSIHSGLDLQFSPKFHVSIGNQLFPTRLSLGIEFKTNSLSISLATTWQENLNLNPSSGLVYEFPKSH